MRLFAIVSTQTGKKFGSDEEFTHENLHCVRADDYESAIKELTRRESVGALANGITYKVYEIGPLGGVWHAQYDGPPMDDHRATSAELVIARRLDLEHV